MLCSLQLLAQQTPPPSDTLPPSPTDTLLLPDSLQQDTSARDTVPGDSLSLRDRYRVSSDSLDARVNYEAKDSMYIDNLAKTIHLYREAKVTYKDISLKADHIVYSWETGLVTAEGWPDSSGQIVGKPLFNDGTQEFNAERMEYNVRSRKGVVYDVSTQYNQIYVRGRKSKFISEGEQADTSREARDVAYSQGAIFTTCTHENPHFGIRSGKQKVIPNKLVVVGPSNLEIMNVPTPLVLPFGFFPITKSRSSGLLFPRDYEYSDQWGFGLRDIGWFFPVSDYLNLSALFNIYLKGTFGAGVTGNYRKRYKYSGSFNIAFDSRRSEANDGTVLRNNSYILSVNHNQDPNAHPTNTFGGSINIQANRYQSTVNNDAQNVLENTLRSNFQFRKQWRDKPISMSIGLTHSQNTRSREVNINFPNFNFRTQNIFPFKKAGGRERWYETVAITYNADVQNRFTATDTTLFSRKTLEDARFGARQQATLSNSFKLFKYLNFNPSINYTETWYLRTLERNLFTDITVVETPIFDDEGNLVEIVQDTIVNDSIGDRQATGFESWRAISMGASLNTQLFGTLPIGRGGFRHTFKPSIGFSYSPDTNLDRYQRSVATSSVDPIDSVAYSIFDGAIFGGPPGGGTSARITYSFNNIFEAKYWSKKANEAKKLKLLDNIIINGSYNFAADSLQWSIVNMNGATRFFNGITSVRLNASFDPYITDEQGRRINTTVWETRRRPLRFIAASATFNTSITLSKVKKAFFTAREADEKEAENPSLRNTGQFNDLVSLLEGITVSHNLVMGWMNGEFGVQVNSINMRGNFRITDKWTINVGNFGYDFVNRGLTYPSVGFFRDLHCWEMGMNWQPNRGTYSFFIRVKPGPFEFLKLPYERNNADPLNAFN